MKPRLALVVDDEPDLRELMSIVLRDAGFEVTTAGSGLAALELLRSMAPPDLIVLDVQMPELDGWDTLHLVRTDERLCDIAVILCTVRSQNSDIERAWRLGCDGYVRKPFAISDLTDEALAVVGRSAEARAALRAERRMAM